MSLLLALGAALSFGLADFIGGITSKRAGAWAVALAAQLGGTTALVLAGLVVPGAPDAGDCGWAMAAGVANGFGTAFLYRGLARGRMAVVAPVSGVAAAVVPVTVGLALGERPSSLVWLGMLSALPGIWLVARDPVAVLDSPRAVNGWSDGVLAGLGFGTLFVFLARIDEGSGLWPLALNQLVAAAAVVAVATSLRAPWVPREPVAWVGVVSGILGGSATIAFLYATYGGYLSVTAVLASLYPAFTVLLAATLLRERVHRTQALGLALCVGAVVLVALG